MKYLLNQLLYYFLIFIIGVFVLGYFPVFIFFAAIKRITEIFLYPSKKLHLYGCLQTFLIR